MGVWIIEVRGAGFRIQRIVRAVSFRTFGNRAQDCGVVRVIRRPVSLRCIR